MSFAWLKRRKSEGQWSKKWRHIELFGFRSLERLHILAQHLSICLFSLTKRILDSLRILSNFFPFLFNTSWTSRALLELKCRMKYIMRSFPTICSIIRNGSSMTRSAEIECVNGWIAYLFWSLDFFLKKRKKQYQSKYVIVQSK